MSSKVGVTGEQSAPRRYVPPHLRNAAAASASASSSASASQSLASSASRDFPRRSGAGESWAAVPPSSRGGGGGGARRWDRLNEPSSQVRNTAPNKALELELFGHPEERHAHTEAQGINFEKYDDIPVEVNGDDVPEGVKMFADLSLHKTLMANVARAQYTRPTPVQKHAIPIALKNRDLMACAQTGSGKTAAFLLPTCHRILTQAPLQTQAPPHVAPSQMRRYRSKAMPRALVLSPTRELTTQIHKEARRFCYMTGLRAVVVYGGQDIRLQLRELEQGCDVLVATPGRLVDLIERARVGMQAVQMLVFDEADRMLDMGFEPQIRSIVEEQGMPGGEDRQTLMFSATFPSEIQALAGDFLRDYVFLAVGRVGSTTEFITQQVEHCDESNKRNALMRLLPSCEGLTLIFVETKRSADSLEDWLIREGINATSIHGDRTQYERESALAEFKSGRCPVMVATDVAARGLDIPNVKVVLQFDLPNNIDDYVHRIGRTGRCGNVGTAIAFVNDKSRNILRDLLDLLVESNQEVPSWFRSMAQSSFGRGHGGGGQGGRRGGGRFGAKDFRQSAGAGAGAQGSAYARADDTWSRGGGARAAGPFSGYSASHSDAW